MSVQDNKQTVRNFLDLLYAEKHDEAFELLTPDATWWIPTNEPGGMTRTKEQMHEGLSKMATIFEIRPAAEYGAMTAEDDRVSVELFVRGAKSRKGVDYGNDYHLLMRLRDGLICEVREYTNVMLAAPLMPEIGFQLLGEQ